MDLFIRPRLQHFAHDLGLISSGSAVFSLNHAIRFMGDAKRAGVNKVKTHSSTLRESNVEQMDLFEAGELVQIKRFLTCWNEAERAKRLKDVKKPTARRLGNAVGGKPDESGGED